MAYRIEVAILQFCPVEKKAPKGLFAGLINYSKTQMDKNQTKTPTREGKIRQQKSRLLKSGFLNGRGGGIRTHDLTVPNRARYHLRYAP